MVRTKSDAGASRVSVAKAPRKILGSSSSGSASSSNSPCRSSGSGISKDRYSGGNSYNPQPTPNWQKGIGSFFKPGPEEKNKQINKSPEKEEMDCSEATSSNTHSDKTNGESPEKEVMDCSESGSKNSDETNISKKTEPILKSPKNSREDSTDISEESSFNKNGVISDDDD